MDLKMKAPGGNRAQLVYLNTFRNSDYSASTVHIANCAGCGTHELSTLLVDDLCSTCFEFRQKDLGLAQAARGRRS